jgi:hypothetical protein
MRDLALPTRLQAIKDFLLTPKHCQSDVLDVRDLKPGVMEVFDVAMRKLSRERKRGAVTLSATHSRPSTHPGS